MFGALRQTGWGATLPWLTYVEEAQDIRDNMDIEMGMTFSREIKIVLAKYSLDGTWLGFERMTTQVCNSIFSSLLCSPVSTHSHGLCFEHDANIHAETSQAVLEDC